MDLPVDHDSFFAVYYEDLESLLADGLPYTRKTLIASEPLSEVRVFATPMLNLVYLESLCRAIEDNPPGPDRTKAIAAACDAWKPVFKQLQGQFGDSLYVGLDGQGMDMSTMAGMFGMSP